MAHCRISTETLLSIQNEMMIHGAQEKTAEMDLAYLRGVNDAINTLLRYIDENNMSKAKKGE
jgi:hypothetical protein